MTTAHESINVVLTSKVHHYFKCSRCGLCCKGSVEITSSEYEKIVELARSLGVKVPVEIRDYITHTKIIMRPTEDSEGEKWCVFLRRENGQRSTCMIYSHRPSFCRLFPLYIGVLEEAYEGLTVYVDVIHCPEVRHLSVEGYMELDEKTCAEIVLSCIKHNREILTSVPSLNKEVIVFELGDRVVTSSLLNKYKLVYELNRILIRGVSERSSWLELLQRTLAFQYAIREEISTLINSARKDEIAELARVLPERVRSRMDNVYVGEGEVTYMVNTALSDIGLKIDKERVMIHDARNIKLRVAMLDLAKLRENIGSMFVFLEESIARLPMFYQILHLPLEVMYSHGYFLVFTLAAVYSTVLADLDADARMASIDMGALPYVFKYVTALARTLYSSQVSKNYTAIELSM